MKTEQKQEKGVVQRLEEAIFSIPEKKTAYENLMVGLKTVEDIKKDLKKGDSGEFLMMYWETAEGGDKYLHEITYWKEANELTHRLRHEDVIKLVYDEWEYWGIFDDKYYNKGKVFYPACYLKDVPEPMVFLDSDCSVEVFTHDLGLENLTEFFDKLMSKYQA